MGSEMCIRDRSQGPFVPDNWATRALQLRFTDQFASFPTGGIVLKSVGGTEIWHWTFAPAANDGSIAFGQWGNLVQGMGLQPAGEIDGVWASSQELVSMKCEHHSFRSYSNDVLTISQQSIHAEKLSSGATAVVLGCPGGRIRVLLPGSMRTHDSTIHGHGDMYSLPEDLGVGCSALAVRKEPDPSDKLNIWFGTHVSPDVRPMSYHNSTAALNPNEVSSGCIHVVTWDPTATSPPSYGFSPIFGSTPLQPTTANPRGASSVVGMLVEDLLPETLHLDYAGDELIVCTLTGDIIIYSADSMIERWRTHVHGTVGNYNSIQVADLNSDGKKELYLAGSHGLWKFIQQGETP